MVGGTTFRRTVIHGEIPESWSFNLSGNPPRCFAPHRKTMPLTTPSLLSRGTRVRFVARTATYSAARSEHRGEEAFDPAEETAPLRFRVRVWRDNNGKHGWLTL